jgi:hypothetical protein
MPLPPDSPAASGQLDGHHIRIFRLDVIEAAYCAYRVPERRMVERILQTLTVQINGSSVIEAFEVLRAVLDHPCPVSCK